VWSTGPTAPQKTERGIRFAEELADRTCDGIADGKAADNQAGPLQRAGTHQDGENHEQCQAFQWRFIELARMSRQRPSVWKYHRPLHVGGTSPQFAIDEIGYA